jgi:hypothetical protein
MTRRRAGQATAADLDPEALGRQATDSLLGARARLLAVEAAGPWASRILLAGAVGDRRDVVGRAVAFLVAHFFDGKNLEAQHQQVRRLLNDAPGARELVERYCAAALAASGDGAFCLGIALGLRLRVNAEDVKNVRVEGMIDAGNVKRAANEKALALGPEEHHWTCDDKRGA